LVLTQSMKIRVDSGYLTYRYGFSGQYSDKESNLYYNYYRDFDPTTGRFWESDPIGLKGGPNTYLYVNANPIDRVDPYGLYACDCRLDFSSFGYVNRQPRQLCEYKCRCWCGPDHTGASHELWYKTDEGPSMFGFGSPPGPCILTYYNPAYPNAGNALASFDTAYTRWNPTSSWWEASRQFHDSMKASCKGCPK